MEAILEEMSAIADKQLIKQIYDIATEKTRFSLYKFNGT